MTKHIALLMGGLSKEREVSLLSGKAIEAALKTLGYKVTVVDPDINLSARLLEIKPDIVFNALHGTYGEDGAIPGLLETLKIPYTHSGILASSVGLNKDLTKKVLQNYNIRFPKGLCMDVMELIRVTAAGRDPLPRPYVIKPISQGSTIGVYIIHKGDASFADQQLTQPWHYGPNALVEEYIPGMEISSVVVQDRAIGTLELRPHSGFYDYDAKYTDGKTEHIYPAPLPQDVYKESLHFAETAHKVLGCRTISRSDMRYNPDNGLLYFLEINTHPGFTNLSIVPEVASYHGISFIQLVDMIIQDARLELEDAA